MQLRSALPQQLFCWLQELHLAEKQPILYVPFAFSPSLSLSLPLYFKAYKEPEIIQPEIDLTVQGFYTTLIQEKW